MSLKLMLKELKYLKIKLMIINININKKQYFNIIILFLF